MTDDCPFNDMPVAVRDNVTCYEFISMSPWECYDPRFQLNCCDSCFYAYTSFTGCEYGDRVGDCLKEMCSDYNDTRRSFECCETCSDIPFPTRPTRTTTAMPLPITMAPTTPSALTTTVVLPESAVGTTNTQLNVMSTSIMKPHVIATTIYLQNKFAAKTSSTTFAQIPVTSPNLETVTVKMDPVTTLYDVGGVTFRYMKTIPHMSQAATTQTNMGTTYKVKFKLPETTVSNLPQQTPSFTNTLIPSISQTTNRFTDLHERPTTTSVFSKTTPGYISQNEVPVISIKNILDTTDQYVPSSGRRTYINRDSSKPSTNDKSNEIYHVGNRPKFITVSNGSIISNDRNMDITSTSHANPTRSNIGRMWPPIFNRYFTPRPSATKRVYHPRNSGSSKPGADSAEDGNSSGGISEEESRDPGLVSWQQRFLHRLLSTINHHQQQQQQQRTPRTSEELLGLKYDKELVEFLIFIMGNKNVYGEDSSEEDVNGMFVHSDDYEQHNSNDLHNSAHLSVQEKVTEENEREVQVNGNRNPGVSPSTLIQESYANPLDLDANSPNKLNLDDNLPNPTQSSPNSLNMESKNLHILQEQETDIDWEAVTSLSTLNPNFEHSSSPSDQEVTKNAKPLGSTTRRPVSSKKNDFFNISELIKPWVEPKIKTNFIENSDWIFIRQKGSQIKFRGLKSGGTKTSKDGKKKHDIKKQKGGMRNGGGTLDNDVFCASQFLLSVFYDC